MQEDTSPVDFPCRLIEIWARVLSHETDSRDIYLRRACRLVKTEQQSLFDSRRRCEYG